ncbi:Monooxygenase FAD-binding protein [Botryosphaeria dothidea]|uniref:Monooxygenase FAD-binding protein n=1 Tax=Botryosphaeria dothidea TaxID=55169 RepID=A0A8H4N6A6_9PEZI|nr:Monooxygenase FAD-binding protein [Botryosphaeria dothidea]
MESKTTVLIVGAGPVGLILALRLSLANVNVTVVEAQGDLDDAPKAMAHLPAVFPEFKKAGIFDDLVAEAGQLASTGLTFRRTSDSSVLFEPPHSPARPGVMIIPQGKLTRVVYEHVKKNSNVTVLMGHALRSLDDSSQDTIKATVATSDGPEKDIEASIVVGADGGRSTVRKLTGIQFEGETLPCQLVASDVYYDFAKHGGFKDANFMADTENYGLISQITSDGLWRVSFSVPLGFGLKEIENVAPEKFEAMFPGPRPLQYKLNRLAPYKAQQLCATTFRKGRVLLAGDAAHLTNPYAGWGMATGVFDAGSLADALASHLQRGAPDGVLDAWANARRKIFLEVVDPVSRECFWAMQDPDFDSLPLRHPHIKAMKAGKPLSIATDATSLEGYVL